VAKEYDAMWFIEWFYDSIVKVKPTDSGSLSPGFESCTAVNHFYNLRHIT
jgi:hypothetical protein